MRARWLALSSIAFALACRPQPSATLELPPARSAEPSGFAEGPTVIADAALPRTPPASLDPELDWTKVDDRFADLVLASGHERARVPYDAEHPTSGSAAPLVTVEVLATVRAGCWTALIVSVTGGDVVVPDVAVARFVTRPASMSAWVVV